MASVAVIERRLIGADLLRAVVRWQWARGFEPLASEEWLEVLCQNEAEFAPGNGQIRLAIPPCNVRVGDGIDIDGAEPLEVELPGFDDPDGVPQTLAVATIMETANGDWAATCPAVPETSELFAVADPEQAFAVLRATKQSVVTGALGIAGRGGDTLWFTAVEGEVVAWGCAAANVPSDFDLWLAAGADVGMNRLTRGATSIVGRVTSRGQLLLRNDRGGEHVCELVSQPAHVPSAQADDYFAAHAHGAVEMLHIDKPGGIGFDALSVITRQRPAGSVVFTINDHDQLTVGERGDSAPVRVEGPGFTALEGRRNVPFEVPYPVAVGVYEAARAGVVDLGIDDRRGFMFRSAQGIRLEWDRHARRTRT